MFINLSSPLLSTVLEINNDPIKVTTFRISTGNIMMEIKGPDTVFMTGIDANGLPDKEAGFTLEVGTQINYDVGYGRDSSPDVFFFCEDGKSSKIAIQEIGKEVTK